MDFIVIGLMLGAAASVAIVTAAWLYEVAMTRRHGPLGYMNRGVAALLGTLIGGALLAVCLSEAFTRDPVTSYLMGVTIAIATFIICLINSRRLTNWWKTTTRPVAR